METQTTRNPWRDPLVWFIAVFAPLWVALLLGWWNGLALTERLPILTVGILDTILVFAAATTLLVLCVALILRWQSRLRFAVLLGLTATLTAAIVLIPQYFDVVLDGDVRPQSLRWKQAAAALTVEADAGQSPLNLSPTSFPQFLGPNRDLSVPWFALAENARAQDCQVVWRREVGPGWSGFSAVDGLAFTMEQRGPMETVVAYRISDGKSVWFHETPGRHADPAGGVGPRSTPTFHDNLLYTLGAIGNLTCFQANTGEVKWQLDLTKEFQIPVEVNQPESADRRDVEQSNLNWGRAASPLIVGDLVVVPVGGASGQPQVSLAAFDRLTGERRWTGGQRAISYGSPTLLTLLDQPQIVLTTEAEVCGFDPQDGRELWSHSRPGNSSGDANTSQPLAVGDDQLLLTKEYGLGGEMIRLARTEEGTWSTRSLWRNSRVLKTKLTIAAVRENHAYAISGGILECVELTTGSRAWRGDRVKHGQLLLTRNHLLVMSEDGELSVVATDPREYQPLFTLPEVLSGRCWNTLCLYDDMLLVRSDREAVCLRLPTQATADPTAELTADPTAALGGIRATRAVANFSRTETLGNQDGNSQKQESTPPARPLPEWLRDFEAQTAQGQRREALATLDGLLQQYPDEAFAYYQRGCLRCWLGDFTGSVADFDHYVKQRPEYEQRFWERGISYYFTQQYVEGAKQFELYQSYHDNDVENSVWRYLCQAKVDGHEAAQKQLLPIKNDPRIPLMDIYRLFRGEATQADVIAAMEAGDPSDAERQSRRFYGHYYLALYHESHDRRPEALQHIKIALEVPAQSPRVSRYMWDVAKVHAQSWEKDQ